MTEIAERRAAILEEMKADGADLNALEAEIDALENRESELNAAAEKREAMLNKLKSAPVKGAVVEEKKMDEVRTFGVDTVEYRDAYLKNLMGKTLSAEERTALTSAAAVIPTETVNKIYGLLEENPLIAHLNALHIPGYVQIPVATAVNDASWLAVGTESTDSADVVGSISLAAKKLIKTLEITADIQNMAIPAFQTWLTERLAGKMAKAICAAVISGAGSATVPTGILNGRTADTVAETVAGLAAEMAEVGTAYHNGAVWIMNAATFYGKVLPLAQDSNGIVVNDGIALRLFGHEVVLESSMEDDKFIFGNLTEGYVFNFGADITIEADQSVAFRSGSTVYRAMALCDGAPVDADAFAYGSF